MASCSIIGHREFKTNEDENKKLKKLIADLILNKNVDKWQLMIAEMKAQF